jgi:hypothetical protein
MLSSPTTVKRWLAPAWFGRYAYNSFVYYHLRLGRGRVRQLRIYELDIDQLVVHQRHSARP